MLLDTGIDKRSADHIREFADSVDRPYERVPIGLDYFRLFLSKIVLEWRQQEEKKGQNGIIANMNRRLADLIMVIDLIAKMTMLKTEELVIEAIFELFAMPCAPAGLTYLPVTDDGPVDPISSGPTSSADESSKKRLIRSNRFSSACSKMQAIAIPDKGGTIRITTEVMGTGLGLSVSYGIIKNNGGRIDMKSEASRGTTFTIILPIEGTDQ